MKKPMTITAVKEKPTDIRLIAVAVVLIIAFAMILNDDWQATLLHAAQILVPIAVVIILNLFIAPLISTSLHYQINDQRLRCGAKKTTYWQVPLNQITKIETRKKKDKVVEVIVHTNKDSFQMMGLDRFEPAAVQDFLHQLDHATSSNLAAQHGLSA